MENTLNTASEEELLFFERHNVFLRKARQASHQAFYFLHTLEEINDAKIDGKTEEYSQFVMRQLRAIVNGVYIQKKYWEIKRKREEQEPLTSNEKGVYDIFKHWEIIREKINKTELSELSWKKLENKFQEFLDCSAPKNKYEKPSYIITTFFKYFHKNLALFLGVIGVVVTCIFVEAVNNLLFNDGWRVIFPVIILLFYAFLYSRAGKIFPKWNIGEKALRSFRYMAVVPDRGLKRWPKISKVRSMICRGALFRAGSFLFLTGATVFVFYLMAYSSMTLFTILALFFLFMFSVHLTDLWDFHTVLPIRFIILSSMGLFLFFTFFEIVGIDRRICAIALFILFIALSIHFSRGLERKIFVSIFFLISVLIIIGKITTRHEIWRDPEISDLKKPIHLEAKDWPYRGNNDLPIVLMAASGGGSRAAIYTAMALSHLNDELPNIAEQIQCISSVSGGSLANAAYTARLHDLYPDRSRNAETLENFIESMKQDFLFPTLIGALCPGMTRGNRIEKAWEEDVGLGNLTLSKLAEDWRKARSSGKSIPPYPIPLFNSCTLDGHCTVLSPLAKYMYSCAIDSPSRTGKKECNDTWVYSRDGIYSFEDFLEKYDPKLSKAVRASANFPFGFPLVRIITRKSLYLSPDPGKIKTGNKKMVRLTDGGVLSNSGMWSLFHLMMNNAEALIQKGVLLIVVEASKMPEYDDRRREWGRLFNTLGDKNSMGQNLHKRMFDLLRGRFGHRLAVVQLDLIPDEDHNVYTTWALDSISFKSLKGSFDYCWKMEKPNIESRWKYLKNFLLVKDDIKWDQFCTTLHSMESNWTSLNTRICSLLETNNLGPLIEKAAKGSELGEEDKSAIVRLLNTMLSERDFYHKEDFMNITIPDEALRLLRFPQESLTEKNIRLLNRTLLEAYYSEAISRGHYKHIPGTQRPPLS